MGLTLGQKIRRLRHEQGLSQQQLAGNEMTRAFVSLVEQDKCQPSTQTLGILARRLGKPVEFFLNGRGDEEVEAIELLLQAAERATDRGDSAAAMRNALGATRLTRKIENEELECRARRTLGRIYLKFGRFDDAYEQYEEALDICKRLGDRGELARGYSDLGRAALAAEDHSTARRQFERAAVLAEGKKSLQELRANALLFLGWCYLRLGQHDSSIAAYEKALATAQEYHFSRLSAYAYSHLGSVLRRQGQLDQALSAQQRAVELLTQLNDPQAVPAVHNLALVLLDLNRLDEAFHMLRDCLRQYVEQGDVVNQAKALDEVARYWLYSGNLAEAEACCDQALHCLDLKDEGITRGRVYRMLGRIYKARGNRQRANELFRIGLELFRRLKAMDELLETVNEMGLETEVAAPAAQTQSVS